MPEPTTALHTLSASDLLTHYRSRELSPVAVMRSVLDHAARCEPHLAATWALDAEGALAAARAAEARWQRGEPLGALDGVPVTVKENIPTRGVPVPLGSAAQPLVPAPEDSPPAARLREAGAILWCKTTMPDYGMLSSGLSSFHALARNPWDLSRTPGGSSAGGAAAAAAGYGPLHIGTDIGGSLRLPAGWCGIFSLKPSLGRVPIAAPFPGRVAGPMTRTVADSALLMQVLSQPDVRDTMSLPPQTLDWQALNRFDGGLQGLHIGLMLEAGWGLPVDPDVTAAVLNAAQVLEAAGAVVTPMAPILTPEMAEGMDRFWRMRFGVDFAAMAPERQAKILPFIRLWAEGAQQLSGADVYRGFAQMGAMREAAVAGCRPFDFVISPTAPITAFAAELPCPTNDPAHPLDHIGFTVPFNMSEQPAASIPCGMSRDGLPIGLQVVGQRFDDLGVLQLCAAFERLRAPLPDWPTVGAAAP
ncbi:MAG: hypothetical protein RJA98_175 [Pseudomonadota bacterium]|jgi:Asp-tRNA(Asn)/Glu-tRNA(Gln) amidotransferase A subunit family amidase